jgi:hypothetical protein
MGASAGWHGQLVEAVRNTSAVEFLLAGILKMRKTFLTINYLALVGGVAAWVYVAIVASMNGPARVTELDRNGVFNEAKLREYSPRLAENLRYNVGNWIQEPIRSAAIAYAQTMVGLALMNLVGFHFLGTSQENGQQSAGGNAASTRASV